MSKTSRASRSRARKAGRSEDQETPPPETNEVPAATEETPAEASPRDEPSAPAADATPAEAPAQAAPIEATNPTPSSGTSVEAAGPEAATGPETPAETPTATESTAIVLAEIPLARVPVAARNTPEQVQAIEGRWTGMRFRRSWPRWTKPRASFTSSRTSSIAGFLPTPSPPSSIVSGTVRTASTASHITLRSARASASRWRSRCSPSAWRSSC